MTTAAEATRAAERPVSRGQWLRRTPAGRFVRKLPFWLLIAAIFVYALFPFYWAVRSAFTPEGQLFNTPIQYFPDNPTLANFREIFSTSFFTRVAARFRKSWTNGGMSSRRSRSGGSTTCTTASR